MSYGGEDVELEHLVREFPEKNITVIGVAHESECTSQLAYDVITDTEPDVVAFESCPTRLQSRQESGSTTVPITLSSRWKKLKARLALRIVDITSSGSALHQSEHSPTVGDDFAAAFSGASEVNANVGLIDRGLETTLDRFVNRVSWCEVVRLGARSMMSPVTTTDVASEESVETFSDEYDRYSAYSETFIHERDDVMAYGLLSLASADTTVVGVVGAGHLPGIERRIKEPDLIADEHKPDVVDLVPVGHAR